MKNKGGQPTVMTKECLQLLREAFSWGCTDSEACCYANIGVSTLYLYCSKNPDFLELKNTLKDMPMMKARRVVNGALDDDDINTAHKVIDRKEGSKVKTEHTGADGNPIENKWTVEFVNAETTSK
jgi:hypothetical protein